MADFRTINASTGLGSPLRHIGTIVAVIIVILVLFNSTTRISTGHVGVVTLFSRVTGEVLHEGIHLISPLKSVTELSIRTQTREETATVPSNEGLILNLDTSVNYHLRPDRAAEVFQNVGPRYDQILIEPAFRSVIREVTAAHSANALYSAGREEVTQAIFSAMQSELGKRGIEVEMVFLRDIQLPPALKTSIEMKQQAEQESLAMSFKLQKEKQEAERKRIEAQGIHDFQQTVSQGISTQLLEWKGIEATENLAKSANTKIVVIGNSKNGLPLVLGGAQ